MVIPVSPSPRGSSAFAPRTGHTRMSPVPVPDPPRGSRRRWGLDRALRAGEDRWFRPGALAQVSGVYDVAGTELAALNEERLGPRPVWRLYVAHGGEQALTANTHDAAFSRAFRRHEGIAPGRRRRLFPISAGSDGTTTIAGSRSRTCAVTVTTPAVAATGRGRTGVAHSGQPRDFTRAGRRPGPARGRAGPDGDRWWTTVRAGRPLSCGGMTRAAAYLWQSMSLSHQ